MNMEAEISTENEAVEKMNDEKMIRALNSNVKLGCLQSIFEQVQELFCAGVSFKITRLYLSSQPQSWSEKHVWRIR